ncbi:hypothetical protein RSD66_04100 [Brevundimonas sp. S1H14]|uniref:hypothetical protein n=1 Tax=Brevundimonas sp. S1H14 TaxID=3078084 RepID=UPI0039E99A03
MAEADREALIAFEVEADARIEALPIGELPVRAFWTFYHCTVFLLLHGGEFRERGAWVTGDTLAGRMSYLLPWLRNRPTEPIGANGNDAFAAVTDYPGSARQIADLSLYAHFCELMPDVHRRLLDVERSAERAFRLVHPDAAQARAEATDILVSELALNQNPLPENRRPDEEAFTLARDAPHWDMAVLVRLVRNLAVQYQAGMVEHPLVTDEGVMAVFGFDSPAYREVQAALFAFADAIQQVGTILCIWAVEDGQEDHEVMSEALEWMSVYWQGDVLIDIVAAVAGVDRDAVSRFVDAFTLDYDQPAPGWEGGEGYSPPFIRLAGSRLFSPDFIKRFAHARNALVMLDRNNDPRFDNLISRDLEPVLLQEMREELENLANLTIVQNFNYDLGELDLVIVAPDETHVVIVEAKAPLPPQGVRATARLAGRMREGVRQIARFHALPRARQLEYLRRATGLALLDPEIEFWLAGRACFGAREVWLPDALARPVTLPLLRLAVRELNDDPLSLAQLGPRLAALLEEMLQDLNWRWEHAPIVLFEQALETPQLLYDRDRAAAWRIRAGGPPGRGAAV